MSFNRKHEERLIGIAVVYESFRKMLASSDKLESDLLFHLNNVDYTFLHDALQTFMSAGRDLFDSFIELSDKAKGEYHKEKSNE